MYRVQPPTVTYPFVKPHAAPQGARSPLPQEDATGACASPPVGELAGFLQPCARAGVGTPALPACEWPGSCRCHERVSDRLGSRRLGSGSPWARLREAGPQGGLAHVPYEPAAWPAVGGAALNAPGSCAFLQSTAKRWAHSKRGPACFLLLWCCLYIIVVRRRCLLRLFSGI